MEVTVKGEGGSLQINECMNYMLWDGGHCKRRFHYKLTNAWITFFFIFLLLVLQQKMSIYYTTSHYVQSVYIQFRIISFVPVVLIG
jgi:hypothetical protein